MPQAVTLGSLQSTENSEFPEMCWTYQITFLSSTMSQKFTVKITDSKYDTVNHTREDL